MGVFDALGVLVGAYTGYAAWTGEVYAKSGVWGRSVRRDEAPRYFWVVIGCYTLLAVALVAVF